MPATVTLASLISTVRQRTETERSAHVTDTEIGGIINSAYAELGDLIGQASGSHYSVKRETITTVAGTDLYDLPDDFLQFRMLEVQVQGGAPGLWAPVRRAAPGEYNAIRGPYPYQVNAVGYKSNLWYDLSGSQILLLPCPAGGLTLRLTYVPVSALLCASATIDSSNASAGDSLTLNGVNYIVVPPAWEQFGLYESGDMVLNDDRVWRLVSAPGVSPTGEVIPEGVDVGETVGPIDGDDAIWLCVSLVPDDSVEITLADGTGGGVYDVTQDGEGPAITVSGSCPGDYEIKIEIEADGDDRMFHVSLDGTEVFSQGLWLADGIVPFGTVSEFELPLGILYFAVLSASQEAWRDIDGLRITLPCDEETDYIDGTTYTFGTQPTNNTSDNLAVAINANDDAVTATTVGDVTTLTQLSPNQMVWSATNGFILSPSSPVWTTRADDHNGWLEYVVLRSSIMVKNKAGYDISLEMALLEQMKERITRATWQRNVGEPGHVADNGIGTWWGAGYGGGWGT